MHNKERNCLHNCDCVVILQAEIIESKDPFQISPVWKLNHWSPLGTLGSGCGWGIPYRLGTKPPGEKILQPISSASCQLKQRDYKKLPFWRVNFLFILYAIFDLICLIAIKVTKFQKNIPKCWGNSRIFFLTGSSLVIKYRVKSGEGICKLIKSEMFKI